MNSAMKVIKNKPIIIKGKNIVMGNSGFEDTVATS